MPGLPTYPVTVALVGECHWLMLAVTSSFGVGEKEKLQAKVVFSSRNLQWCLHKWNWLRSQLIRDFCHLNKQCSLVHDNCAFASWSAINWPDNHVATCDDWFCACLQKKYPVTLVTAGLKNSLEVPVRFAVSISPAPAMITFDYDSSEDKLKKKSA